MLRGAPRPPLARPAPAPRAPAARRAHRAPAVPARAAASADAPAADRPRPGEKKGFVEEMRFVAMQLHTKDQAPKEGGRQAAHNPWAEWKPTREGYLRFLAESRAVYAALESAVASDPRYAAFRSTGLERVAALDADIAWFDQEYGLTPGPVAPDGPGGAYAALLTQLAKDDPPAFICHFYNVYFAHTAGGRMIGVKLADMLLDRRELAFYKYDGDYKPLLDAVRASIDGLAAGWTRDQKDACLNETAKSFQMSGALLRAIAAPVAK